jgi:hypothetical protein
MTSLILKMSGPSRSTGTSHRPTGAPEAAGRSPDGAEWVLDDTVSNASAHRPRRAAGHAFRAGAGGAHDRDDLVHSGRIRRVAKAFIARRDSVVEAGRGGWGAAPAGAIEQWYGLHGRPPWRRRWTDRSSRRGSLA